MFWFKLKHGYLMCQINNLVLILILHIVLSQPDQIKALGNQPSLTLFCVTGLKTSEVSVVFDLGVSDHGLISCVRDSKQKRHPPYCVNR